MCFSVINIKIAAVSKSSHNRKCRVRKCLSKIQSCLKYEGCFINKLQNGIIVVIFKVRNIRNIGLGFVGNLIVNISYKFSYDDATVTLFINIKCGGVAVESIP